MTDHAPPSPFTRRRFLATSALGAVGLACTGATARTATDAPMPAPDPDADLQLYVGSYTPDGHREGVHLVRLDGRTGALTRLDAFDVGPNPSFLAIHPDGQVLYAVNEVTALGGRATGGASAFAIANGGALARLGAMRETGGGAPCYVSVARGGRAVLVANYVGGNLAVMPVGTDGALGAATQVAQHRGSGPHRERQDAAHAHSVVPDPTGRWALACDLGVDRVFVYALDAADADGGALREASATAMPAGAGPRHLAFHPRLPLVYVANELANTVSTLGWDAARGTLALRATQSTLPAGWTGRSQGADLHVAPDGASLYVSNRGHDSLAVFAVDAEGGLALRETVPTEGHWPRNFSIAPGGRWVVVANERADALVVLARDAATGRLTPTGQRLAVPKPVCVRFRAHAGITT